MSGVQSARTLGRPRSAEADRAILDAALEIFAEQGYDGLTIEGVAARAGVGKATIYRRYPSKVDLVMAAASCLAQAATPEPDTGSVADDLRVLARGLVHVLTQTVVGRVVPQIVAEVPRNPELAAAYREFVASRRRVVIAALERGIARGELRADTDAELVADLGAGPIFYRHLVSGGPLDESVTDRVVDSVTAAFVV